MMRGSSTSPNLANATGVLPAVNAPTYDMQLLFIGRGLNFAITTDQQLTGVFAGTKYMVTNVVAAYKTGGASVTCVGGVYTAASKGGNALVAATQSWVSLASGIIVNATLASIAATSINTAVPYLSLTTGSTAACTADLFVYGVCID